MDACVRRLDIGSALGVLASPALRLAAALALAAAPLALVTNTSSVRARIVERSRDAGLPGRRRRRPLRGRATAAHLRGHHPGARCLLLNSGDVTDDLEGVTPGRAGRRAARSSCSAAQGPSSATRPLNGCSRTSSAAPRSWRSTATSTGAPTDGPPARPRRAAPRAREGRRRRGDVVGSPPRRSSPPPCPRRAGRRRRLRSATTSRPTCWRPVRGDHRRARAQGQCRVRRGGARRRPRHSDSVADLPGLLGVRRAHDVVDAVECRPTPGRASGGGRRRGRRSGSIHAGGTNSTLPPTSRTSQPAWWTNRWQTRHNMTRLVRLVSPPCSHGRCGGPRTTTAGARTGRNRRRGP